MNLKILQKLKGTGKKHKVKEYIPGALMGAGAALLCAEAFYDMDSCSFWLFLLILPGSFIYRRKAEERAQDRLLSSFRDGLQYAKNALDAGDSAENAFGAALLPLKNLYGADAFITKGFMEICRKTQNGTPLENAVSEFAVATGIDDITDFAGIFPVLKRTGGDMNVFVAREIKNITDRQNLKRELNAVTAGKRNEFHIMCMIPVAMLMYLKIFSGEMLETLYHNAQGEIFMTMMLVLYAVCILGGEWILKKNLG